MKIADIVATDAVVPSIDVQRSALAAAQRMGDLETAALIVTKGGRFRGLVTERDLVTRIIQAARPPASSSVESIMTTSVVEIGMEASFEEAAALMARRGVAHLLVRRADRVVAIVTALDLLGAQNLSQTQRIDLEHFMARAAG